MVRMSASFCCDPWVKRIVLFLLILFAQCSCLFNYTTHNKDKNKNKFGAHVNGGELVWAAHVNGGELV